MKIILLGTGKTDRPYLREGIAMYEKRICHYLPFEIKFLPDLKLPGSMTEEKIREREGAQLLSSIRDTDTVVLLDEQGKEFSSTGLAGFLKLRMNSGIKNLVFIVGGPYGFSEDLTKRAHFTVSLSKLTFSHQLVRLIFMEQLYRACTIIKGDPYHHA